MVFYLGFVAGLCIVVRIIRHLCRLGEKGFGFDVWNVKNPFLYVLGF